MPNIFNTVGNIQFFNFISNTRPSGVPTSILYTYSSDANFRNWLNKVAFLNQSIPNATGDIYFRFPYDSTESALSTENILSTSPTNTQNNMRFYLSYRSEIDPRIICSHYSSYNVSLLLNTKDVSVSPGWIGSQSLPTLFGSFASPSTLNNYFSFGVKSPTTVVMTTIEADLSKGNTLDLSYSKAQTVFFGWMHNGIYTSPLPLETQRFYGAYVGMVGQTSQNASTYSNFQCISGGDKGLSTSFNLQRKYIDIVLQNGEYVPGLFVTDLVFVDDFWVKRGKADNRILAMGRGNFKPGQVYQITNPFGRVGNETWICLNTLMPATYSTAAWSPGADTTQDRFKYWKVGEYDYLLMRIYTEAD